MMHCNVIFTDTIALGNPGSGKSTILNSLAGEAKFKSGLNIGTGLTSQLGEWSNKNGRFLDTPGLADADEKLRADASKAIGKGLKKGDYYKILFFVTEIRGKVRQEDVTTMKLILEAAPDIGMDYGVIINMISKGFLKKLKKNGEFQNEFLDILFEGIPANRRCSYDRALFLGKVPELEDKDDVLADSEKTLISENMTLTHFVKSVVPTVHIKKQNVKDIKFQDFIEINRDLEAMARKREDQKRSGRKD